MSGNNSTWPHFLCPNCRAVANLEADIDEPDESDWEDEADAAVAKALEESRQEAEDLGLGGEAGERSGKRKTLLAVNARPEDGASSQGSGTPVVNPGDGPQTLASPLSDAESVLAARLGGVSLSAPDHDQLPNSPATAASPTAPVSVPGSLPIPVPVSNSSARGIPVSSLLNSDSSDNHSAAHTPHSDDSDLDGEAGGAAVREQFADADHLSADAQVDSIVDGPMTPRNDAGPFILDGAGSVSGRRSGTASSATGNSIDDAVDANGDIREGEHH